MDAKYYCDHMQSELTGLKARVYNIIASVDKLDEGKKAELKSEVSALHALVADLNTALVVNVAGDLTACVTIDHLLKSPSELAEEHLGKVPTPAMPVAKAFPSAEEIASDSTAPSRSER